MSPLFPHSLILVSLLLLVFTTYDCQLQLEQLTLPVMCFKNPAGFLWALHSGSQCSMRDGIYRSSRAPLWCSGVFTFGRTVVLADMWLGCLVEERCFAVTATCLCSHPLWQLAVFMSACPYWTTLFSSLQSSQLGLFIFIILKYFSNCRPVQFSLYNCQHRQRRTESLCK